MAHVKAPRDEGLVNPWNVSLHSGTPCSSCQCCHPFSRPLAVGARGCQACSCRAIPPPLPVPAFFPSFALPRVPFPIPSRIIYIMSIQKSSPNCSKKACEVLRVVESHRTFATANREGRSSREFRWELRPEGGWFFERFHIDRESSTRETSTGKRTVMAGWPGGCPPRMKDKTDRVWDERFMWRCTATEKVLSPRPVGQWRERDTISYNEEFDPGSG